MNLSPVDGRRLIVALQQDTFFGIERNGWRWHRNVCDAFCVIPFDILHSWCTIGSIRNDPRIAMEE